MRMTWIRWLGAVLAVLAVSGCGVMRFTGGSSKYDLKSEVLVDPTSGYAVAVNLSKKSTSEPIATCILAVPLANMTSGDAFAALFASLRPEYSIPTALEGQTKVRLLNASGGEVASCQVENLTAWRAMLALRGA